MKRNLILSLSILMLVLMQACGGGSEKAKDPNMGTAMADPFEELNQMVESIIDGGGVAALGEASSRERSMAKSAAEVDARGKLAQIFNAKVQRVQRKFEEEVGDAEESEINRAFSNVTKILTSQELTGSRNKKTLYTMEQKNGKTVYQAGVVMAIEPKVVNQAIMNEMKENKQLYDRFRASQAYKDLEAEMEKYEAEQNQ
jgi:hypothetical protein